MATSLISIIKIAGDSTEHVLERFRSWEKAKTHGDDRIPEKQWAATDRAAADHWATQLREHAHEPPILWFSEHVDHWSAFPPGHCLNELSDEHLMCGDRFTLLAFPLPMSIEIESGLLDDAKNGQYDEIRFFARMVLQAAAAWANVIGRDGVIVLLRQTYCGSLDDAVIQASMNIVPKYLNSRLDT